MLAALPFRLSSVDVPAGMSAALELALHERGIPTLGIWAQVPHYVVSMAYPAASVALLDGLATATGITIAADELRGEAVAHRQRIDQLIAANDEHQAMVEQFERMYDAAEQAAPDGHHARRRARDALGRRARRRGRALPPRPGQELNLCHHIRRRRFGRHNGRLGCPP